MWLHTLLKILLKIALILLMIASIKDKKTFSSFKEILNCLIIPALSVSGLCVTLAFRNRNRSDGNRGDNFNDRTHVEENNLEQQQQEVNIPLPMALNNKFKK